MDHSSNLNDQAGVDRSSIDVSGDADGPTGPHGSPDRAAHDGADLDVDGLAELGELSLSDQAARYEQIQTRLHDALAQVER